MAVRHNKKGVFFTFIAILLVMVLMMVFNPQTETSFDKDFPSLKTRVSKIDNFITEFEAVYLERILQSATYKALISLTYYMDQRDSFLTDLQGDFKEVVLFGTIEGGTKIDDITGEDIMKNSTLLNWTDKIKAIAKDNLNIDMNITVTDVSINQSTPWLVDVMLSLDYTVSSETAFWRRENVLIKTKLGTGNLYDPLYYVNTDGVYEKKVVQTNIRLGEWNATALKQFIRNDTYFRWQGTNASSFLMRFTNTFEPSQCCGIESVVNPNNIAPSDVIESYVDYHFWNDTYEDQCEKLYNITEIWDEFDGFKLDFDYTIKYNVTGGERTC